jgi:hypothetical protein
VRRLRTGCLDAPCHAAACNALRRPTAVNLAASHACVSELSTRRPSVCTYVRRYLGGYTSRVRSASDLPVTVPLCRRTRWQPPAAVNLAAAQAWIMRAARSRSDLCDAQRGRWIRAIEGNAGYRGQNPFVCSACLHVRSPPLEASGVHETELSPFSLSGGCHRDTGDRVGREHRRAAVEQSAPSPVVHVEVPDIPSPSLLCTACVLCFARNEKTPSELSSAETDSHAWELPAHSKNRWPSPDACSAP